MTKKFCDICKEEITKDKRVGMLFDVNEKTILSFKNSEKGQVLERKGFDLCNDCLQKAEDALGI